MQNQTENIQEKVKVHISPHQCKVKRSKGRWEWMNEWMKHSRQSRDWTHISFQCSLLILWVELIVMHHGIMDLNQVMNWRLLGSILPIGE